MVLVEFSVFVASHSDEILAEIRSVVHVYDAHFNRETIHNNPVEIFGHAYLERMGEAERFKADLLKINGVQDIQFDTNSLRTLNKSTLFRAFLSALIVAVAVVGATFQSIEAATVILSSIGAAVVSFIIELAFISRERR